MIDVLQTIAMLCAIHTGTSDPDRVMEAQRKCQVEILTCFHHTNKDFITCVKERK